MIPSFIDLGNPAPWPVLPAGIHWAELKEIEARFATNSRRRRLFGGFEQVVVALAVAGCSTVYLDGSFVTAKPLPDDFDGCWDPRGVVASALDPTLLDFNNNRNSQKNKYLGEMFISTSVAGNGEIFLDFFQKEKFSGKSKGIVGLRIK